MIHYQVAISLTYPSTHKRKGERTYFVQQIKNAICDGLYVLTPDGTIVNEKKFHTCRKNYAMWVKRMKKVNDELAVIDLFYWKLKGGRYNPDNEKIVFVTLDKNSGCGVQELQIYSDWLTNIWNMDSISSGDYPKVIMPDEISKNDGLLIEDFKEWFKTYDLSQPLAIIQFTQFRY